MRKGCATAAFFLRHTHPEKAGGRQWFPLYHTSNDSWSQSLYGSTRFSHMRTAHILLTLNMTIMSLFYR